MENVTRGGVKMRAVSEMNIMVCKTGGAEIGEISEILKDIADEYLKKKHIDIHTQIFDSVKKMLFAMKDVLAHIIITDIEVGNEDVLQAIQSMRNEGFQGKVVFFSTIKERVYESFKVNPFYYGVFSETPKVKKQEVIARCIDKIEEKRDELLHIKLEEGYKTIDIAKLDYVSIRGKVMRFVGEGIDENVAGIK